MALDDSRDFTFDIETYLNCFTCVFVHVPTQTRWIFEVSDRINQSAQFIQFIYWLRDMNARMFGYNNEGFDYPVIHALEIIFRAQGYFVARDAWEKAQAIIAPKMLEIIAVVLPYYDNHSDAAAFAADCLKAKKAPTGIDAAISIPVDGIIARKVDFNGSRFANTIWANQRLIIQGDLYKIHHYDNLARSTSLKKLEIAMRSHTVIDLPYKPHLPLNSAQMDEIVAYNCHDVLKTQQFYDLSRKQIEFRDELAIKYPDLGDVLNFNDTKIGKKFFERQLEQNTPGICYTVDPQTRRKVANQSHRPVIKLGEVISPKIGFDNPEFQRIMTFFKEQTITKTKGFFAEFDTAIYADGRGVTTARLNAAEVADVTAAGGRIIRGSDGKGKVATHVGGIDFIFGLGGIHGSRHKTSVFPDDEYDLIDVDVASYYPNLFITGRFYPEHLSEVFCDIYFELYGMRLDAGKKSLIGQMIKLALNGVYGDTGNVHGPFFDPKCMMQVTINGQLMLCMLAELAMNFAGAQMVQINTDGITCRVPKIHRERFEAVCAQWEIHTGLELEHVEYSAMHIRDVNNYLAVKSAKSHVDKDTGMLVWEPDEGIKRIGAYQYVTPFDDPDTRERQWHKNHSALVVPKAAEAWLLYGQDIADFVMNHRDPFDFQLSEKVDRTSRLEEHWPGDWVNQIQGTSRYYVSTVGCHLFKVMPPIKGKTEERYFAVQKGWTVKATNTMDDFDWSTVNWLFYIEEAKKLTSWMTS